MATVEPVIEQFGSNAVRVTWASMHNGDVGAPVPYGVYPDRSIQVTGTFGAGGSVSVLGSNDGTNFVQVSNQRGTAFAMTSAGLEQVEDVSYQIKPQVTAGDGTTSLTVTLFARTGRL